MVNLVFGNSLWQLIRQSDIVTQIVLLILVSMSVVCWAIFFYKIILLRLKKQQLKKVLVEISQVNTIDRLLTITSAYSQTLPGYFLSKNLLFLKTLLESELGKQHLNPRECEFMQHHIVQTIDEMVVNEESYLTVLSTTAAAAPLLGLFGTVWGLVHSFVRISELQAADITVVAPGIAEALITTLMGLMVAIPVLVMYSYLSSQIRIIEQLFMRLGDRLSFIVQQFCISE
jgi:biopolymer transport protein ExbB/TolQ